MNDNQSNELLKKIINNESIPSPKNSSSNETEPLKGVRPITEGARPILSTLNERNKDKNP